MRVGYIIRYWPTLSETFIVREIAALRDLGVQIDVVALGRRRDPRAGEPLPAGVEVVRPPRGWRAPRLVSPVLRALAATRGRREVGRWRRWLRPKDVARALWLAELARRRRWGRMHAHFAGEAATWAALAAPVAGIPFSVTVHANDLFRPRPELESVLRAARPAVVICEHHQAWVAERYQVDTEVVRCGVDPERYPAANPRAGRYAWVSVARDTPMKGLDDLVAAAKKVPGVLRLVSDGVRYGGPGVLAAPAAAQEVPRILAQSQTFVLPCRVASTGQRDGVPVALMEAMAAGLPVVSTTVSGIGELVDDTVGWVVPPNDPVTLAATLKEVARSPEERQRRGLAGRRRIVEDGWTLTRQASELAQLWQVDPRGERRNA